MGLLYEALKQINPGHLVCSQLSYGKTSSQQNLLNQSVESYRQESPRGKLIFIIIINFFKPSDKNKIEIKVKRALNELTIF